MAQYIDKSALVAKIKKLKGKVSDSSSYCNGWQHALRMLELSLDTLEVKEVDFDAEWERYFEHRGEMATVNVKHLAKYFFELGLKVAQKGD